MSNFPRSAVTALLIDLDGVLRRYDDAAAADLERSQGLPPGTILAAALDWTRLLPAITGRVSRETWLAGVAEALADRVGGVEPARAMLAAWDDDRGAVVPEVLEFVRAARAGGVRVGLATNATDDLDADLERLGLLGEFDAVVSSARLGIHKPAPEFFAAACAAVRTAPDGCLFVDDDDRNVTAARAAGLRAYRYNGPDDFRYLRAVLGLPREAKPT